MGQNAVTNSYYNFKWTVTSHFCAYYSHNKVVCFTFVLYFWEFGLLKIHGFQT